MLHHKTRFPFSSQILRMTTLASVLMAALSSTAGANPRIVVDVRTGRVIEHEDAFRKWYPASLTKLMTTYVTFRAIQAGKLSLESPVTMSQKAAAQPASKMYFKAGQQLTLDSALKIMLVKSANDIAMAIGETVGGGSLDTFVGMMNSEAARLGMSSSHFINPNGLPGPGQYTTARDLAVLAVALRREFPQFAGYFALEGFTTGQKAYPNINMLIGRFDGADGMKTGFICASGFNQISSATRDGRTVVSVVLGTSSLAARTEDSANLLQKAFSTAPGGNLPSLAALAPYGENLDQVVDVSADICNPKAAQVRSETRDDAGRMIIKSPFVHELTRPLEFSYAGLIPGTEKPVALKKGELGNVPIPMPRPTIN